MISKLRDFFYKSFVFLNKLLLAIVLDVLITILLGCIYWYYFTKEGIEYRVKETYKELIVATGQTQDALPIYVVDSPIVNAYNDGKKIVIYTALIDQARNWDEVALVIGHEIAHGMLGHLLDTPPIMVSQGMAENDAISILEANADKMGAFYMIKAGYDICKGREIFKHWQKESGDSLGGDHPNYSYRYDQLNINCD